MQRKYNGSSCHSPNDNGFREEWTMTHAKKISCLLMLLLCLVCTAALAQDSTIVDGDFTYTVNGSYLTLTGYSGTDAEVTIPSSVQGSRVTAVGAEVFAGSAVERVVLPDNSVTIGSRAFANCTALVSVMGQYRNGIGSV